MSTHIRSDQRLTRALVGAALAIGLAAAPVSADHTFGTLECGVYGEPGYEKWDVEAASIEPLPKFESPVPWSGLFLLEGTTRVYHAFSIDTSSWDIKSTAASRNPHSVVACTLSSTGFNFPPDGQNWLLLGFFTP